VTPLEGAIRLAVVIFWVQWYYWNMENNWQVHDFEKFSADAQRVIKLFNQFVFARQLDGKALPDHICYRCASSEEFEEIRFILEPHAEFLYQSLIAGRRIAYVKLRVPFKTRLGDIWFVELSDQKPDNSQTSGFQHIEIFSRSFSYEALVARFQSSSGAIASARPHHQTFDVPITDTFQIRVEPGPLIEKIKTEEIK
jgi:predicted metalloenzyme YecM